MARLLPAIVLMMFLSHFLEVARAEATPERDVRQAEVFISQGAWPLAEELLVRSLGTLPETEDGGRIRRRVLLLLADLYRQSARHEDGLRYGLLLQKELARLPVEIRAVAAIENALRMADNFVALQRPGEGRALLTELLAGEFGTLKPVPRLQALVQLAAVEEATQHQTEAAAHWEEAVSLGSEILQRRELLQHVEEVGCLRRLACAREALRQSDAAARTLEKLHAALDADAPAVQRQTWMEMAGLHALRGDSKRAVELYGTALELTPEKDLLGRSRLHMLLADLLQSAGNNDRAKSELRQAAALYEQLAVLLKKAPDGPRLIVGILRQLRGIYQQLGETAKAIDASDALVTQLIADLGEDNQLVLSAVSIHGALLGMAGRFPEAEASLKRAVSGWRKSPSDRLELASALNNLGAVFRSRGDYAAATTVLEEALSHREALLPPDHPDLAVSLNNLASVYVARGEYRKGLESYRRVERACLARGPRASALLGATLLNMAMVYKSQGQMAAAIELCQRSLEIQQEEFGVDSPHVAGHLNALSTLHRAQGDYREAYLLAQRVLKIAAASPQDLGALTATAHYNLGIICRLGKAPEAADKHLRAALALQDRYGQRAAAARTRNYLGLLAFEQQKLPEAKDWFEQSAALQKRVGSAPQDRFSTLCNLAGVEHELGHVDAALALLGEAQQLAELSRVQATGDESDRATLFARFGAAIEMQVLWNLDAGRIALALEAAERGRSRTFLDQLQLAQVDLRTNLIDADGRPWTEANAVLAEEQSLRERINSIQAQAAANPLASRGAELEAAQTRLAKVWSDIRAHSGSYRRILSSSQDQLTYADIQRQVLEPDQLLVYYVIGQKNSYAVLVAADGKVPPEIFPLVVSPPAITLLERELARRPARAPKSGPTPKREVVGTVTSDRGEALRDATGDNRLSQSLTRASAIKLVAWYLDVIERRKVSTTREVVDKVISPRGEELVETQTLTALAEVFLPAALRVRIAQRKPRTVVVIPDGPVHQLPLEALVVREGTRPTYALDVLPPLVYAPSAGILRGLRSRPAAADKARKRLLTVGDPAYPEAAVPRDVAEATTRGAFLGLGGRLLPLPESATEVTRIETSFLAAGGTATKLLRNQATEAAVVSQAAGCGYVHLAAHGLVDERFDNLFGAIALTPPGQETNSEDGFLSYNEILELPLQDCELAVLSACRTNVGPDRPLEAASSLAQAFLAAGARRVVASHWSVADQSTSELISRFFNNFLAAADQSPTDYATCLCDAKRALREQEETSEPFFWAPFVLIGPARDGGP